MTPAAKGIPPETVPEKRREDSSYSVSWGTLLALCVTLASEFLLFQRLDRAAAGIYPRWFDQIQYLTEAYKGYEYSLEHGFLAGVWQTLVNTSAQGTLHDFWALLVFQFTGPSRAAALDVNMLWFLAAQAVTFLAVRKATRSGVAAWVSVAFLAALLCPWSGETGSATDFRLDWMAACAYGVALGAATACDGFRSTGRSAVFGLAVGIALLTRFLTGVYFGLIFISLLIWVLSRGDRWPRFWRLVLSKLVAFAIAAPVFWMNRATIYNYYWIGHVTGAEPPLRDSHLGSMASVHWVARELLIYKVGLPALALFAATLVAAWALGRRRTPGAADEGHPPPGGGGCFLAIVFLLAPFAVLCFHPVKAPQTIGVMVVPAVWLAVLGFANLARRLDRQSIRWVGGAAFVAGVAIFAALVLRKPYPDRVAVDSRRISAIADYAYFRAEECDVQRPRLAATLIADSLVAGAFSVMGYERHHHWIEFVQTLPTGLYETSEKLVLDRLGESDFVCLLSRAEPAWPYDRELSALLGVTRPWCDAHMVHLADTETEDFKVSVYERRGLEGVGGAGAVDLSRMLAEQGQAPPGPPAAPVITSARRILWSAEAPILWRLRAAYSPVRYAARGLPDGLRLEERTGEIRGKPRAAGDFPIGISATNGRGAATGDVLLSFRSGSFLSAVEVPDSVRAGVPAEFDCAAFDSSGTLDYIDINDQTAGTLVARLTANELERVGWQVRKAITFAQPGVHRVNFRFVRYDPGAKEPYSFADELRLVPVGPQAGGTGSPP